MSSDSTFLQKLRSKLGDLSEFLAGEVRAAADDAAEDAAALAAAEIAEAERAAGADTVGAPWIVLARVEGEDSIIPKKDRLTAGDLKAMAESYDPALRRAPVVLTHKGEQSLGYIEAAEFDGVNLLGQLSEIQDSDGHGLVAKAVSRGWIERSIRFWRNSPELEGRPPYLIHVALLSGEAPAQHSLPPLSDAFSRSLPEAEIFCDRSLLNNDEPQELNMDKNELAALVGDAVRSAVEPLETRLKAAEDRAAAAEASAAELAESNRKAALEGELRSLVAEGKVAPAEKSTELDLLLALPSEKATERLAHLRSRGRMIRSAETLVSAPGGGVIVADRRFSTGTDAAGADPNALAIVHEAERSAGGDFARLRAEIYTRCGEPLPAQLATN